MKSFLPFLFRGLILSAFAVSSVGVARAADVFEGRVHMELTSGKKKEPMGIDYAMKDGKLRMDMPQEGSRRKGGGMGGMIYDLKNQEMIILMENDGEKTFMRRSMKDAMAKAQERNEKETSAPVATGRTETIAGYKASEYKYTNEKGEVTDLWLAKGLGTFMYPAAQNPMGGRGAPSPEWEKIAREGGFFPLRVIGHNKAGAEVSRMEVTKIEKTSLPDSLFSTDGYTEFKMPDFGGAFNPFKR
jgi:hypothetical protein